MGVEVLLLGTPLVTKDDEPVGFDTRKALALLAFIAVGRGPQPRDSLAAFLWPEGDLEHARGALRRTLSSLRRAVGDAALKSDRMSVALTDDVRTDVAISSEGLASVERHHPSDEGLCDACRTELQQVLEAYRGPFMAGFSLRGVPEFDDWRAIQEEAFRKGWSRALRYLVLDYERSGDHRAAAEHAQRWVTLDPLHEPAHAALMRSLALQGDRDGALTQYGELVRVLDEELGVAPLEETVRLQDQIARGALDEPFSRDPRDATRPAPSRPLPFVARSVELEGLARTFAAGGVMAIEGEAGIGKTRLAREAVRRAAGHGAELIEIPTHEEESDHPYGLIARLLAAVLVEAPARVVQGLDDPTLAEAARLVPELRELRLDLPEPAALGAPGAKTNFFEGVREALAAGLAEKGLPVVLLEDLQWSDETSLHLLAFILRRVTEIKGAFVMTWRTEDVGRDHRLRRMVTELTRSGTLSHVVLGRLEEEDVIRIVSDALPDVDGFVAARLFEETEGVPFYLAEYVAALADRPGEPELPSSARAMVRARIDSVTGATRQLLTAASVLGRSFDLPLAQATAGRSDEETVDALDELVARGLLAELSRSGEPAYDFTHERIRASAYEEASLARRRLLHGRAADHLLRTGGDSPGIAPLAAHHCERAGRKSEAAELHRRAGDESRDLYANAEALAHYEAALALGAPDAGGLQEAIGDMLVLLGRYEAALRSYEVAAARGAGDGAPRLERKLGAVRLRRGEKDGALAHLERALAAGGPDGTDRGVVLAELSLVASAGDPGRAERLAREALSIGEARGDDALTSRALNLVGMLARKTGETDDARAALERSISIARDGGLVAEHVAALNNLAMAMAQGGRLEEAVSSTEEALALCRKHGDLHRQAALHNNLADLFHRSGKEEESREQAKAAARLFAQVGDEPMTLPEIWMQTEW